MLTKVMYQVAFLGLMIVSAIITAAQPDKLMANKRAFYFTIKGFDYNKQVMLFALQGIVNRKAECLFYDTSDIFWQWRHSDSRWMKYYSKRFKFVPIKSTDELLRTFKQAVKGLCIYDSKIDATRYIAATLAGLEDLLPVSAEMIEGELRNFAVILDLRNKFSSSQEAYKWAIEKLIATLQPFNGLLCWQLA